MLDVNRLNELFIYPRTPPYCSTSINQHLSHQL